MLGGEAPLVEEVEDEPMEQAPLEVHGIGLMVQAQPESRASSKRSSRRASPAKSSPGKFLSQHSHRSSPQRAVAAASHGAEDIHMEPVEEEVSSSLKIVVLLLKTPSKTQI